MELNHILTPEAFSSLLFFSLMVTLMFFTIGFIINYISAEVNNKAIRSLSISFWALPFSVLFIIFVNLLLFIYS
ncbi:hypothetical protein A3207_07305 [Candidatus Methanomassiliicoccus intestinalis]|uniref:Uncharacterized protein n=1 Tax=Candidatus Methanomassiliicoccus intestinalis TaxID=1406512 RepID=A0A8J8TE11_9ARCH|nr:MAG: hypothetical protein A3207_07305 [Candidatus Methanomassiliicoccus intestinalis]